VIPITESSVAVFTIPTDGRPDLSRPGFGLEPKRADAARYAA
jgi:hypothetical protein